MPESPVNKRCFAIKPALATALITRGHRTGARSAGEQLYGADPRRFTEDNADTGRHYLLIRRNDTTGEHAYLRCYSPRPATLHALVTVAGQRWRIGKSIHAAKGLTGLDQHHSGAGRPGIAGPPWPCSPMPAWLWQPPHERDTQPAPTGVIVLTVNESRRLFDPLFLTTRHIINSLLAWSRWRRQHQYRAPLSHYRRRETNDHELRLRY
jgi:hypothetical protein